MPGLFPYLPNQTNRTPHTHHIFGKQIGTTHTPHLQETNRHHTHTTSSGNKSPPHTHHILGKQLGTTHTPYLQERFCKTGPNPHETVVWSVLPIECTVHSVFRGGASWTPFFCNMYDEFEADGEAYS
jgi:hypothetical protein